MNDEEGEIVCSECAKSMDNVAKNKAVQKMIDKLKIHCLSVKKDDVMDDGGQGNIDVTMAKDNECNWTGMIKEFDQHEKECPFWIIQCDECKQYECQRQLMATHLDECPEVSIQCPLNCGMSAIFCICLYHIIYCI